MITMKDLSFQYNDNDSANAGVKDISLEIQTGECVLLCGRSGCGKSTLLKLLNGLIPKYYPGDLLGEIWIDKKRIDEYPMYELSKKMGTVFQNPRTQFFNVDVSSEIVFGMENFAMPYDHMEERRRMALKDFELEELSENSIFDLSGGEKQRVAFASIYAENPEIYLLDEPSSNLDSGTTDKLANYIQRIKEQKKTVLIAEHRLYYLMKVIDRVLYMEQGRILKDMSREEFLALPEEEMKRMGLRTRDIHPVREAVENRMIENAEREAENREQLTETYGINVNARSPKELEIRDLTILQNKIPILENVRFNAQKGDIIAIVGKNGIGKTSLIRYLCGLHKHGSGRVILAGRELGRKERTRASYIVMQDVNYQLFAETVLAECSFGLKEYDETMVEDLLRRFDLWDVRFQHPNTLSGGQKQRLAVIGGFVGSRELLIFDEPTSGLDYDSMKAMAEMIQEIAKDKIIFIVTHDDEFIHKACTGILPLDRFVPI